MENENLISNQDENIVKKVSLKEIEEEKNKLSPEELKLAEDLAKSILALNEEQLKRAIAFVDKKIKLIKKLKQ